MKKKNVLYTVAISVVLMLNISVFSAKAWELPPPGGIPPEDGGCYQTWTVCSGQLALLCGINGASGIHCLSSVCPGGCMP